MFDINLSGATVCLLIALAGYLTSTIIYNHGQRNRQRHHPTRHNLQLPELMTPEQIERNKAFLADLRANDGKEARKRMRIGERRCCLCVAYDTAQRLGAGLPPHDALSPPREMAFFYGWEDSSPYLTNEQGKEQSAADWNDSNLSHSQIADLFERNLFPEK